MAIALGVGLVPVRKAGKLPGATIGVDYALEYGIDRLELHDAARSRRAQRVLLVDDLIATGGTVARRLRAAAQGRGRWSTPALFVIDLPDLGGAAAARPRVWFARR